MTIPRFAVVAAVVAMSTSAASYASIILPGGLLLPTPVVSAPAGPSLAVVDTSTSAFTGLNSPSTVVFTGSETSTVYSGDTNGLGGLTFTYSVSNNLTSADQLERVTVSGFAGFTIDVGYVVGSGTVPTLVNRSPDGDVIGFDFYSPSIAQGATGATLIIHTTAPYDVASTISIIDGGTGTAATFSPSPTGGTPTPEPASLAILGISGLVLLRRRA